MALAFLSDAPRPSLVSVPAGKHSYTCKRCSSCQKPYLSRIIYRSPSLFMYLEHSLECTQPGKCSRSRGRTHLGSSLFMCFRSYCPAGLTSRDVKARSILGSLSST